MIYSFSIFETLVIGNTATSEGIFALMQAELLNAGKYEQIFSHIRENFYELRTHAEELARLQYQRNGIEEVTLAQIYEALATTGNLTKAEQQVLIDLEHQIIYENTTGLVQNVQQVKVLHMDGARVILVADTCLAEDFVRKLLKKIDSIFEDIPMYISSSYKLQMATGSLYKKIYMIEQVEYENWFHCGGACFSDKQMPQNLGIQVETVENENLLAIEKQSLQNQSLDALTQLMIGTAKKCRQLYRFKGAAAVGCSVGGPILFAYVQWIIAECKRRGIKRLYFIARDGYIPKKIFDIVQIHRNLGMQSYYIYGSRKTWRFPAYSGRSGELSQIIGMSYVGKIKTIEDLAEILMLSTDELLDFLPEEYDNFDQKISVNALNFCVRMLEKNSSFRQFLVERWRTKRELVKKYIMQEIDLSDDAFAFVEIGGTGLTQECLAGIMQDFYKKPIQTFFFKMDSVGLNTRGIYYNFLPSRFKHHLIVELLCRASHEQAVGYTYENGKIVPVLTGCEGKFLHLYGYDDYIDGIEKFSENYAACMDKYNIPLSINFLFRYFDFIMNSPDHELLTFFADMPHGSSGRESRIMAFAPRLTKKNIRDLYLFYPTKPVERLYGGADLEYAKLRCTAVELKKIDFYKKNRLRIIDRLKHLAKYNCDEINEENLFAGIPFSYFGQKIVLYGAGKWGRHLYQAINASNAHVVQWLDKNHRQLTVKRLPVVGGIEALGRVDFDVVLIAVADKKIAGQIKADIVKNGMPDEKIICIWEYIADLNF